MVTASAANAQCCRDLDAACLSDDVAPVRLDEDFDAILDAYGGSLDAYRHQLRRGGGKMTASTDRVKFELSAARRVRLMMACFVRSQNS
ncbi:hypothetical protein [Nonomuraea jabiensis]|uniref:Uncharacterized protein n=1 Tax=Nonomuraea jabiensis TaxID=882448 RepID=A0A7W9G719_9ACTN|nr:hypothetical protein [Nonomuraea jabiensis]MBB5778366.1 hypothetical protein [Nonomuraea jabiensis]